MAGMESLHDLQLFTTPEDLDGTAYIEFLPGRPTGECWNTTSVFLEEETFTLIEAVFEQVDRHFDHYGVSTYSAAQWQLIIDGLLALQTQIADSIGFDEWRSYLRFHEDTAESILEPHFASARDALMQMIDNFVNWLRSVLKTHPEISVLGM